jgi:hypothetical protein
MSVKILLAGEVGGDDWETLEPSRWNQAFRSGLANDLKLIADRIANGGANEGAVGGIRWRLEPSIAKPAEDEAA